MVGVDASAIATSMVRFQSLGDRSIFSFVKNAMSQLHLAISPHRPVPMLVQVAKPVPAPGNGINFVLSATEDVPVVTSGVFHVLTGNLPGSAIRFFRYCRNLSTTTETQPAGIRRIVTSPLFEVGGSLRLATLPASLRRVFHVRAAKRTGDILVGHLDLQCRGAVPGAVLRRRPAFRCLNYTRMGQRIERI